MLYSAGSVHDISVDADTLGDLTWLGHELWFADPGREQAAWVDPKSGTGGAPLPCPGMRAGLGTLHSHLVYAAGDDMQLHVLDPQTGQVISRIPNPRPGEPITAIEAGRNGLWLGYRDAVELRSTTDLSLITRIPAPLGTNGLTVTQRYVAYTDLLGEAITIVDQLTERTALQIHVDGRPTGLTWDGLRVWYSDAANIRLRAIDVPGLVGPA